MLTSASGGPVRKRSAARSSFVPLKPACATGFSPAWDVSPVLRVLADENFNGRILRALRRQIPDLDVVRAQDRPLSGADDQALLQFAADENRILLTHDVETL